MNTRSLISSAAERRTEPGSSPADISMTGCAEATSAAAAQQHHDEGIYRVIRDAIIESRENAERLRNAYLRDLLASRG